MTASASVVEALKAMKDLDTRNHHVGYDNGPGGGNYVYQDVVFTDELYPLIDKALSALNAPQPAEQDAREAVALGRTLYEAFWSRNGGVLVAWCDQASAIRNMWDAIADDAQSALTQAAPDGWVLVPVEPTREMIEVWHRTTWPQGPAVSPLSQQGLSFARCYRAMLSASPAPPAQGAG